MLFSKLASVGLFCLLLVGCATLGRGVGPDFRVVYNESRSIEMDVSPDRVVLECDQVEGADDPDTYFFYIHVLKADGFVFQVIQSTNLTRSRCDEQFKKITRILKKGKRIFIGGVGDLTPNPLRDVYEKTFGSNGKHKSDGSTLSFDLIANDRGGCYGLHTAEFKPCPYFPYPHDPASFRFNQ